MINTDLIGRKLSSDELGGWYGDGDEPEYNVIVAVDEKEGDISIASIFKNGRIEIESCIPSDGVYNDPAQNALSHLEAARRELLQAEDKDEDADNLFADTNVVPDISYVILVLKGLLESRDE